MKRFTTLRKSSLTLTTSIVLLTALSWNPKPGSNPDSFRIQPKYGVRARRALSRLTPLIDDEGTRFALGVITDLAEKNNLSVYDATYLELAMRRMLPIASRDAGLNRAARLSGVETLL